MELLDIFLQSKSAWLYVVTGEIALLFAVMVETTQRTPRWNDLWTFFVFSLLVSPLCILVDNSPMISLFIGLGARIIWPLMQKAIPNLMPGILGTILKNVSLNNDKEKNT